MDRDRENTPMRRDRRKIKLEGGKVGGRSVDNRKRRRKEEDREENRELGKEKREKEERKREERGVNRVFETDRLQKYQTRPTG